jgi:N utilization substance protein B
MSVQSHHYRGDNPEDQILRIEPDELFENDPERDANLSKRRLARERVMQAMYARAMGGGDGDEVYAAIIKPEANLDTAGMEFAQALLRRFCTNEYAVNSIITSKLTNWDISRVALLDKILLEIGITEFLYFPEIPPKATINELIEIAKDYSTDESSKFINGILHKIKEELISSGMINKTGRGLIE